MKSLSVKNVEDMSMEELSNMIESRPNAFYYFHRGMKYMNAFKMNEAIEDFSNSIRFDSSNTRVYIKRSECYQRIGNLKLGINDLSSAIAKHEHSKKTIFYEGHFSRGTLFKRVKQYEKAISDFSECIRAKPLEVGAIINRGNCYRKVGSFDLARKDYEKSLDLEEREEAFCGLASVSEQMGNFKECVDFYSKCDELFLKKQPQKHVHIGSIRQRARIYFERQKDFKRAIEDTTRIIQELSPSVSAEKETKKNRNGQILSQMFEIRGLCYSRLKQFKDAEEDFTSSEKFNGIGKASNRLYFNRAVAYFALKQWKEAKKDFSTFLENQQPSSFSFSFSSSSSSLPSSVLKTLGKAQFLRGRCSLIMNEFHEAEMDFVNAAIQNEVYLNHFPSSLIDADEKNEFLSSSSPNKKKKKNNSTSTTKTPFEETIETICLTSQSLVNLRNEVFEFRKNQERRDHDCLKNLWEDLKDSRIRIHEAMVQEYWRRRIVEFDSSLDYTKKQQLTFEEEEILPKFSIYEKERNESFVKMLENYRYFYDLWIQKSFHQELGEMYQKKRFERDETVLKNCIQERLESIPLRIGFIHSAFLPFRETIRKTKQLFDGDDAGINMRTNLDMPIWIHRNHNIELDNASPLSNGQLEEGIRVGDWARITKWVHFGQIADLNRRFKRYEGNTLLHLASQFGRGRLVAEILQKGMTFDLRNAKKERAEDLINGKGRLVTSRVFQLFRKYPYHYYDGSFDRHGLFHGKARIFKLKRKRKKNLFGPYFPLFSDEDEDYAEYRNNINKRNEIEHHPYFKKRQTGLLGHVVFEGYFEHGFMNGFCCLYNEKNGYPLFKGHFKRGQRNGKGEEFDKRTKDRILLSGIFKDDEFIGKTDPSSSLGSSLPSISSSEASSESPSSPSSSFVDDDIDNDDEYFSVVNSDSIDWISDIEKYKEGLHVIECSPPPPLQQPQQQRQEEEEEEGEEEKLSLVKKEVKKEKYILRVFPNEIQRMERDEFLKEVNRIRGFLSKHKKSSSFSNPLLHIKLMTSQFCVCEWEESIFDILSEVESIRGNETKEKEFYKKRRFPFIPPQQQQQEKERRLLIPFSFKRKIFVDLIQLLCELEEEFDHSIHEIGIVNLKSVFLNKKRQSIQLGCIRFLKEEERTPYFSLGTFLFQLFVETTEGITNSPCLFETFNVPIKEEYVFWVTLIKFLLSSVNGEEEKQNDFSLRKIFQMIQKKMNHGDCLIM